MSFKLRKSQMNGKVIKSKKDLLKILQAINKQQCPDPKASPSQKKDFLEVSPVDIEIEGPC